MIFRSKFLCQTKEWTAEQRLEAIAGGGIGNLSGTLTVSNSIVSGNSANSDGGGIFNIYGTLTVSNSTVSGNSANFDGGGIENILGTIAVSNSTVSGNSANYSGGGINNNGTLNLNNTIIANSVRGGDCYYFIGTITTNINNLIEDGSCSPLLSGDPNLGPLQNNGGPTFTQALLPGSIAINAGSNATVPPGIITDQRGPGFPRIVGSTVDIGSFEVQSTPPPTTVPDPNSLLALVGIGAFVLSSHLKTAAVRIGIVRKLRGDRS